MSFRGQKITEGLPSRLHSAIWVKDGRDGQYVNFAIDDTNLFNLSSSIALVTPKSTELIGPRAVFHKLKEAFENKLDQTMSHFMSSINMVVNALDKVAAIDRLFLISNSTRREAVRDSDIDIVVYLRNYKVEEEDNMRSVISDSLKTVSTGDSLTSSANSFFLTVTDVDIAVTLVPSFHTHSALQMQSVKERLENAVTDHDERLYAASCSESLEVFYHRFIQSTHSEFYFALIKTVESS